MFGVLFDGREVERKEPNFHNLVRIIIIKKKKEKEKRERKCGEKGLQWTLPIFNFSPLQIHKKIHIPLESFAFL